MTVLEELEYYLYIFKEFGLIFGSFQGRNQMTGSPYCEEQLTCDLPQLVALCDEVHPKTHI